MGTSSMSRAGRALTTGTAKGHSGFADQDVAATLLILFNNSRGIAAQQGRKRTLDPIRAPLAPLTPRPHSNSSQDRREGASGAYKGVKENWCLHTCCHQQRTRGHPVYGVQMSKRCASWRKHAHLTVSVTRVFQPLIQAVLVHELDSAGAFARVEQWIAWFCF